MFGVLGEPVHGVAADAMSLTWLLLMLLVMVAFELLSSRDSLVRLFVRGFRGGRRCFHFFPPLD